MGMKIDESLEWLISRKEHYEMDDNCQELAQALDTAINTMRKYQTMQEVLEKVWNIPSCMLDEAECLNKIMETYRTVRW